MPPDTAPKGTLVEVGAPDPVTVIDQISRLAVPGCGFNQLSPDPGGGTVGRHLEVEKTLGRRFELRTGRFPAENQQSRACHPTFFR